MLFNSPIFLFLFLPVTVAGFFLIGGRGHHRVAIAWLVGASLLFYGWWNPDYVALILLSILFNYAVAIQLSSAPGSPANRGVLIFGIAANLMLLAWFKYANFVVDNLNLAGLSLQLDPILLPLAISFFTFQQIAYLVDAWRGETREYNFLHYCLFVTFFPQLIAGPIVHHREMLPQFANERRYRLIYSNLTVGLSILVIGLFKKIVIADRMGNYATPVFDAALIGEPISMISAWGAVMAYTLQIYFDFSGYSDMAVGIARLFGIRLPINFYSPYKATSIIEFWRRWHITLSRFLRDYLYIPLGGNRKGVVRRYSNLMVTMLLGGIWHGAGWTFVVWGGLHGGYLVINHGWRKLCRGSRFTHLLTSWPMQRIAQLLTLLAVMVAWVFFRAESFDAAVRILQAMVELDGTVSDAYKAGRRIPQIVVVFLLALLWPNTSQLFQRYRPVLGLDAYTKRGRTRWWQWRPALTWIIILTATAWYITMSFQQYSEFLYFRF